MAGENEMLDAVKKMCDGVMARMDSMEEDRKKEKSDAADMKAKWDAAEDEKKKADAKMKADAEAKEKDEKEKADAQAKADAEKEEEDKKAKADAAAKADAEDKEKKDAAARGVSAEVIARIADLERTRPAVLSEDDKAKYAEVQMRCDSAYQAWGKQAPHALNGESLRDFHIRLLTPLKQHSKTYKDSALALIGDDAAFATIAGTIVNDAVEASNSAVTLGAPLQKRVRRTDSGHIETRFVGDPAVGWAEFSGGATKFGKINVDLAYRR